VPEELNEAGVNRGTDYQTLMIRLERSADRKRMLIREQRQQPDAPEDDAISRAVADNYISPLIGSMPIEAYSADSLSAVVKATEFFNGRNTTLNDVFSNINLGTSAIGDLSRIISAKAFDNNVVVKSEQTTRVVEGNEHVNITVETSTSIVLLPEEPMQGRRDTPRIGYFTTDRLFYSDTQQEVGNRNYIQRWRLVPRDTAAYMRGELSEPVKPITLYIDARVPARWRPWLEKGITDWNQAFERAGFKDAIRVKTLTEEEARETDDINYSQLMYVASTKQNAMGPSTLDPRSGEILEADVIWWHNVISMVREWIVVQTAAANPKARTFQLPDDVIGDAMRFVICHEVGHSLGLRHNMMGSWTVPTDSLRSKTFTDREHRTSSSIYGLRSLQLCGTTRRWSPTL